MRLVNFLNDGRGCVGIRKGEMVVDLRRAAPDLPVTMNELLAAGADALRRAAHAADGVPADAMLPAAGLRLLPPSDRPGKVVCVGSNYIEHVREGAEFLGHDVAKEERAATEFPPVFLRGPSSLLAHEAPMIRPLSSEQLDFECELAVIIGRTGKHISKDDALDHVAGYSIFNDGSIRDAQLRTSQWTLGKNYDATGGFGPDLVTPDELPRGAAGLRIQTRLNGRIMQDANTADMIFPVDQSIAIISATMTLEPGDVIIMGTCAGVGLTRNPPVFMKDGDVCEVEIEGIGILSNPIKDEVIGAATTH